MQHTCAHSWCKKPFEVTERDLAFYEKVSPIFGGTKELIPPPSLCPACRSQRRLAFRNERRLYHRKSDATGRECVSMYSPEKALKVYEPEEWYKDDWNGTDFGRGIDVHAPFFPQYEKLLRDVPRISLMVMAMENSPYANQAWYSKNIYLSFDVGFSENVYYGAAAYHSTSIVDCSFARECTLSYQLLDCTKCYECAFLQDCKECTNTYYAFDCARCQNCAFCWNLRDKKQHLFNEPVSKEEWDHFSDQWKQGSEAFLRECAEKFAHASASAIHRASHILNCENCTGDYLSNSHDCATCFDCDASDDLTYCSRMDERISTAMDLDHASIATVAYEGTSIAGHAILFCIASYDETNSELLYCDTMKGCTNCFGCIGLKQKKYCILNTQYTKEEYMELVPKIIGQMRTTGEWGEFVPATISPFAYNETMAQQYFPQEEANVRAMGLQWKDVRDEVTGVTKFIPADQLPDTIDDIPDDILNWAIECEATKKPFKIIKQELEFYRTLRLPVPRFHPDERHRRRMAGRNPRVLWERTCAKCKERISTSYGPEREEIVYCESCYLATAY